MKRLVFLAALMALTMGAFSEGQKIFILGAQTFTSWEPEKENGRYMYSVPYDPVSVYTYLNRGVKVPYNPEYVYLNQDDIEVGKDGWGFVENNSSSPFYSYEYTYTPYTGKVYIIEGGTFVACFDATMSNPEEIHLTKLGVPSFMSPVYYTLEVTNRKSSRQFLEEIQNLSTTNKGACACCFSTSPNFFVEKIEASSYYTERTASGQTIEYIPDVLNYTGFYKEHTEYVVHEPWVPGKGKNGAGIGEYLDITFIEPMDHLLVLNGYVDPFKPYLYKANNRVKKALVRSLDPANPFEVEYEFEDYVHFAEIKFPAAASKVQFVIQEVYPGERWNDTCVSGVYTNRVKH